MNTLKIEHETAKSRFSANVTGGLAVLLYKFADDGSLDIYSVKVPEEARGQKIAEQILLAALNFAESKSIKIIPTCPYVSGWFRRNPGKSPLLRNR